MARQRRSPEKTGVLYIRGISRHVKNQFKAYCARHAQTMAETVELFMRECVRKDNENELNIRLRRPKGSKPTLLTPEDLEDDT